MGYEKTGDIIRDAHKNKYGVAAFNAFNYETMKFAVEAAEASGKPVILQHYPGWYDYISFETTAAIVKSLAKKTKVPVGLHLDHCGDLGTIRHALESGFLSVMYDGSKLPFEQNIENTKAVVEMARVYGADLEAELGNIGSAANVAEYTDASLFTDPDDAERFFEETGILSLAVAVGNAHGSYARLPSLDFWRIETIGKKLNTPLVLHGGSGIPEEQLQRAIQCGISKINVATDYFRLVYGAIKDYAARDGGDIFSCMRAMQKEAEKFLTEKINLFYERENSL